MRICIVAEHASASFGGEAILPVHYFRLLRERGIDARLVVHSRTEKELAGLFPGEVDRIHYVPDLWIHKLLFRLSVFLPRRISEASLGLASQLITQYCQRSMVRGLIAAGQVNLVHQPIPVAPRFPSMMFGLGVPVVIGPLNGGMEYPRAFRSHESLASRVAIAVARQFVDLGNTLIPGKRRADVVLVANARTRDALPAGIDGKVIELVENGIDFSIWRSASVETAGGGPVDESGSTPRFVFIGRLVDWKAVDIAIRAIAQIPRGELEIVGDGPMAAAWKSLATELGVGERVHFAGWQTQQQCAARLRACVALVLPSIYECGGAVVLEAMAMTKPVIAINWGGPADYLNASCGVLVEPASYDSLVAGFSHAMRMLMDSADQAKTMGEAGRERVLRDFDWQRKIEEVIVIYRNLLDKSHAAGAPN